MAVVWSQLHFLAYAVFRHTSEDTNQINKRLITVKGNSSGFNQILITAYRCLLVTLNDRGFLHSPFFFSAFCGVHGSFSAGLTHCLYFQHT